MTMHSAIYEGKVRHRRFSPLQNAFQYRLFLMYVDLSELPILFEGRWLWSGGKVNLAYLRRRDHLGNPLVPLDRLPDLSRPNLKEEIDLCLAALSRLGLEFLAARILSTSSCGIGLPVW